MLYSVWLITTSTYYSLLDFFVSTIRVTSICTSRDTHTHTHMHTHAQTLCFSRIKTHRLVCNLTIRWDDMIGHGDAYINICQRMCVGLSSRSHRISSLVGFFVVFFCLFCLFSGLQCLCAGSVRQWLVIPGISSWSQPRASMDAGGVVWNMKHELNGCLGRRSCGLTSGAAGVRRHQWWCCSLSPNTDTRLQLTEGRQEINEEVYLADRLN